MPHPDPHDPPLLTPTFLRLVAGHFLQALGFSSMLILPLYLGHLDATRAEIGTIMGVASVGGLILRPIAGWALDTIGRRPTLAVGTAILALGMLLTGLVDRIGPLVYTARVLVGVGAGTLFTAYFTFAADVIPIARRAEGIALFGISGLAPMAINGVLGRVDLPVSDLRWVFPAVGVLVLLSLIPVWPLPESRKTPEETTGPPPIRAGRALTARPLWSVWLATVVFSGLVAVFMAFITVTAARRGMPAPADVWFTYAGGAVAVRLFGARLPARLGLHNMVAPALSLYVAGCLLAAAAESPSAFLLAGLCAGLGHGYCFPVLTAQVVDRVPERNRGSGLAAFTAQWELSAIALTPAFGLIADRFDDRTMFGSIALLAVLGLAAWAAVEHRATTLTGPPTPQPPIR